MALEAREEPSTIFRAGEGEWRDTDFPGLAVSGYSRMRSPVT